MMTTDTGEAPDAGKENQQPKTRGGASYDDRSKGLETEQPGSPFGSAEKGTAEPKKEAPAEKTP